MPRKTLTPELPICIQAAGALVPRSDGVMTWQTLDTRKGQLMEMGAVIGHARSTVEAVKRDDPDEHPVGDLLSTAIEALNRAEYELDWASKNLV